MKTMEVRRAMGVIVVFATLLQMSKANEYTLTAPTNNAEFQLQENEELFIPVSVCHNQTKNNTIHIHLQLNGQPRQLDTDHIYPTQRTAREMGYAISRNSTTVDGETCLEYLFRFYNEPRNSNDYIQIEYLISDHNSISTRFFDVTLISTPMDREIATVNETSTNTETIIATTDHETTTVAETTTTATITETTIDATTTETASSSIETTTNTIPATNTERTTDATTTETTAAATSTETTTTETTTTTTTSTTTTDATTPETANNTTITADDATEVENNSTTIIGTARIIIGSSSALGIGLLLTIAFVIIIVLLRHTTCRKNQNDQPPCITAETEGEVIDAEYEPGNMYGDVY